MSHQSKESKETLETKVSKEDQQKKRPARKTKEAATVFLNMVGQKLCKKGKEDDEEHDGETGELLRALRQCSGELCHRLVEGKVLEDLQPSNKDIEACQVGVGL